MNHGVKLFFSSGHSGVAIHGLWRRASEVRASYTVIPILFLFETSVKP